MYTIGYVPFVLVTGYFNNDKNWDLVTVNGGDYTLSFQFGNGDGKFTSHSIQLTSDSIHVCNFSFEKESKKKLTK